MPYRAVLFDLDGTLLNTLEDIASSTNRVLDRLGFPQHTVEAYKYFVGDGREALTVRVLPSGHQDGSTVAEVIACIEKEYSEHWADNTRPYEGIPELLQALTVRGIRMVVLSNKPDDFAKLEVSKFFPQARFELVLGVQSSVPRKPNPTAALEIAEYLNILPSEFLYLGDTDTDMKTANAAGMYAIGVLWGFRTADELVSNGAKALVDKPNDLLRIL